MLSFAGQAPQHQAKHLFSTVPEGCAAVEGCRGKLCLHRGSQQPAGIFICKRMPSLKLAPMQWGGFLFQEVPAIYPTFQLGFSTAQSNRTCLSLYSESTAQQGIRAHNPAGIAALAQTTGPCSLILFLVLSAGMWFVREKALVWLIKEALSKAVKQSLTHSSAPAQPWC